MDKRPKKGILNHVGSAYKWLFGLMDDENAQKIYDILIKLNDNQELLTSEFDDHIAQIDNMNHQNLIINGNIVQLTENHNGLWYSLCKKICTLCNHPSHFQKLGELAPYIMDHEEIIMNVKDKINYEINDRNIK